MAIVEIVKGAVQGLVDAFKSAEFNDPKANFTENEKELTLTIIGSFVSGTHTVSTRFISDYWRGDILISEVYETVGGDRLTVSVSIYHHAGVDRPHKGDALKGEVGLIQLTLDSETEKKTKAEKDSTSDVRHSKGHSDTYKAKLTADIGQERLSNDITAWTFKLEARHNDRTSTALNLVPGYHNILAGLVTVAIVANDGVYGVNGLELTLCYDGKLNLSDVKVEPRFDEATTVDLEIPGHIGLNFKSEEPVNGPETIATLYFHLPKPDLHKSYDIFCVHLEAKDCRNRILEIGCNPLTINTLYWADVNEHESLRRFSQ